MQIVEMTMDRLNEYAEVFCRAFAAEPWNEDWTKEHAVKRLRGVIEVPRFFGLSAVDKGRVLGFVCGYREQNYDGMQFCIQEFCTDTALQGRGIGSALLKALYEALASEDIKHLYLVTVRGEKTEGYYRSKGFGLSDKMIVMEKSI